MSPPHELPLRPQPTAPQRHLRALPRTPPSSSGPLPYVPGTAVRRQEPVYVLTSSRTFSGGEEFAYNLKNLKRATLIGETTGGGAHPGDGVNVQRPLRIGVPFGRAINPITKTNWEGTGVEPDVKVPAAKALATAHLMALEKRAASVTDPRLKTEISAAVERLKKELGG